MSVSFQQLKSEICSRYAELKSCGANAPGGGGFTAGNTCARGGGKQVESITLTKGETLYHVTPKDNVDAIKKSGLLASESGQGANLYLNDVEGVFLANGNQAKVIMQQLEDNAGKGTHQMLEIYLPAGTRVHMDTSMPESAVVVTSNISKRHIKLVDAPKQRNLDTNFEKDWFKKKD